MNSFVGSGLMGGTLPLAKLTIILKTNSSSKIDNTPEKQRRVQVLHLLRCHTHICIYIYDVHLKVTT